MLKFDILSIFPEFFQSPLNVSLLKKAREKGIVDVCLHDIRDWADDKHRMTDDAPYGGGCGMVMKLEPVAKALTALKQKTHDSSMTILTSPQGEVFDQKIAAELSHIEHIIIVCGRYEGVDERIREHLVDREISIGDYILTGGEIAALAIIDAVSRLVPEFLGNPQSLETESFTCHLLEHPQYTRPFDYNGWKVPDVLLSGNHAEIERWRKTESLKRTCRRRPDLLEKLQLSSDEKATLDKIKQDDT